ncbi:phosphoglycolate phosphatase [Roseateles sp. BYS180W]|uniref:Phosphoglycolate phosphatase n=1 Tax=Roseateles rivi TaxID=3299028 RepID=A0ABW7FWA5_9BURK
MLLGVKFVGGKGHQGIGMTRLCSPAVFSLASPRALLFDLDGTLVDTLGDFCAVLDAAFTECGWPTPSRAFVAATIGKGGEHLIRSALTHQGIPQDAYAMAAEAYQRHYEHLNGTHSQVFPGVSEALAGLHQRGLPLVCLTNKPQAFARTLLDRKGLLACFSAVWGGDSFERKKPDPLPIVRSAELLGLRAQQVWMIGDSRNDAQAARAAGAPVMLVAYGYNHGEPVEQAGADAVLESLLELPPMLDEAAAREAG